VRRQCAATDQALGVGPRRQDASSRRPHGHDPAAIAPANCTQAVSKRRTSTTGSPGALRWECSDMGLRPQQQQATTRPRIERQPTNPFTRPPGRRMWIRSNRFYSRCALVQALGHLIFQYSYLEVCLWAPTNLRHWLLYTITLYLATTRHCQINLRKIHGHHRKVINNLEEACHFYSSRL